MGFVKRQWEDWQERVSDFEAALSNPVYTTSFPNYWLRQDTFGKLPLHISKDLAVFVRADSRNLHDVDWVLAGIDQNEATESEILLAELPRERVQGANGQTGIKISSVEHGELVLYPLGHEPLDALYGFPLDIHPSHFSGALDRLNEIFHEDQISRLDDLDLSVLSQFSEDELVGLELIAMREGDLTEEVVYSKQVMDLVGSVHRKGARPPYSGVRSERRRIIEDPEFDFFEVVFPHSARFFNWVVATPLPIMKRDFNALNDHGVIELTPSLENSFLAQCAALVVSLDIEDSDVAEHPSFREAFEISRMILGGIAPKSSVDLGSAMSALARYICQGSVRDQIKALENPSRLVPLDRVFSGQASLGSEIEAALSRLETL